MLRSILCDYIQAYILVKGTITVPNTAAQDKANGSNENAIFKNSAPFTSRISKINSTHQD